MENTHHFLKEMQTLNNQIILITGGTGSFGQCIISTVQEYAPKCIIVYSRDEYKQYQMMNNVLFKYLTNIVYVIGDIRNYDRLYETLVKYKVNIVVHTAALKHVHFCEINPVECIDTNITGTINVVKACQNAKVEKVLALSTDKCVDPINIYGASKLCLERLIICGNNFSSIKTKSPGFRGTDTLSTKFSVCRYGNVLGSRGSVIHVFEDQIKNGQMTITNPDMTRFTLMKQDAVNFAIECLGYMMGGEIFVPQLPSYSVGQLAKIMISIKYNTDTSASAISTDNDFKPLINIIGTRAGEKTHEHLLSKHEAHLTLTLTHKETNKTLYLIKHHYYGDVIDYRMMYARTFDIQEYASTKPYSSKNNKFVTDDQLKMCVVQALSENV